jgi:acetoacetyl-CoA synthetase
VPAKVLQMPDLPRTRSGKLTELTVRAVVHGEPPGNEEALANLEVLAYFRDRPELLLP